MRYQQYIAMEVGDILGKIREDDSKLSKNIRRSELTLHRVKDPRQTKITYLAGHRDVETYLTYNQNEILYFTCRS